MLKRVKNFWFMHIIWILWTYEIKITIYIMCWSCWIFEEVESVVQLAYSLLLLLTLSFESLIVFWFRVLIIWVYEAVSASTIIIFSALDYDHILAHILSSFWTLHINHKDFRFLFVLLRRYVGVVCSLIGLDPSKILNFIYNY